MVLARKTEEEGRFEDTAYLKQMAAKQVACALHMAEVLGYVNDVGMKIIWMLRRSLWRSG